MRLIAWSLAWSPTLVPALDSKMSDLYKLTTGDLLAYGLLLGVTAKILLTENKDVSCPYFGAGPEECGRRGGMPYADTEPERGDSPLVLKKKVAKALVHETAAIKWRRSLVISVLVTTGFSILVIQKAIPWRKFYLGVIVAYFFIFGSFNYFSYHVSNEAEKRGLRSLDQMYEKLEELEKLGTEQLKETSQPDKKWRWVPSQ